MPLFVVDAVIVVQLGVVSCVISIFTCEMLPAVDHVIVVGVFGYQTVPSVGLEMSVMEAVPVGTVVNKRLESVIVVVGSRTRTSNRLDCVMFAGIAQANDPVFAIGLSVM